MCVTYFWKCISLSISEWLHYFRNCFKVKLFMWWLACLVVSWQVEYMWCTHTGSDNAVTSLMQYTAPVIIIFDINMKMIMIVFKVSWHLAFIHKPSHTVVNYSVRKVIAQVNAKHSNSTYLHIIIFFLQLL